MVFPWPASKSVAGPEVHSLTPEAHHGGIDVGRWLGGGLAAGALIWVLEGVASVLYMDRMEAALSAHGLAMEMSVGTWVITVAVSLLVGLTLVFFYAAAA